MKRICKTCNKEFEGEAWKRQCWDCYENFRGMKRIQTMREAGGILIITHPDVTKDEVNAWIKKTYGSVNDPNNWGAVEQTNRKYKVWWNCQDAD